MAPQPVEPKWVAVVWDGANGAQCATDLNALLPNGGWELTSETATELVLTGNGGYGPQPYNVDVGGAYLVNGDAFYGNFLQKQFATYYRPAPTLSGS